MSRQIVLDVETTGLEPAEGHRIIEIGAIEIIDRRLTDRRFHEYLNPEREVEAEALEVHGIDNAFLADKPRFNQIVEPLLEFIRDSELLIHNADFDVGFLNHELGLLEEARGSVIDYASVTDTLAQARKLHPGQRNSLDALCKRYEVDNQSRQLHGALLDAELLAEVYLAMTGGQVALMLEEISEGIAGSEIRRLPTERPPLRIIRADHTTERAHHALLDLLDKSTGASCIWRQLERSLEGEPEAAPEVAVGEA